MSDIGHKKNKVRSFNANVIHIREIIFAHK